MSKICGLLGGFNRLARVIPNAPSIVNNGYNPVSARRASADQLQRRSAAGEGSGRHAEHMNRG